MPPKRRVRVPANRVYKSSTPLQQTRLPAPKKRVKSYGKKSGPRVSKQDSTLTQIGFITLEYQFQDEEEEDLDSYEEEGEKPRKKRRTIGDKPCSTPQYQTQTITQLDHWSFTPAKEENDRDIFNGPTSSQSLKAPRKTPKISPAKCTKRNSSRKSQAPSIEMPPTPRHPLPQEIPSSQSPGTPLSIQSRTSKRLPLQDKSINIPIPFNTGRKCQSSPNKRPRFEIEDTFETTNDFSKGNLILSSPSKRSSSPRKIEFTIPEDTVEEELMDLVMNREPSQAIPSQRPLGRTVRIEISDSDAESDEEVEFEEPAGAQPSVQITEERELDSESDEEVLFEEFVKPGVPESQERARETCYGDIGLETQIEADQLADPPGSTSDNDIGENEDDKVLAVETFQERTQFMESQRVSTQKIGMMAPRTMDSDIFVSISTQRVTELLDRRRDHETRAFLIPPTVSRIWLYETAPVSTLTYMVVIGPAKRPGEILDESLLSNVEFNAKSRGSWYAYEVLEMYLLANPVSLSQLISNEWLQGPPSRYSRVRPAVLDQLIANLQPPIFSLIPEPETLATQETSPFSTTDTQEAEAQLLSTIKQFTQQVPFSQSPSNQFGKTDDQNNYDTMPTQLIKIEDESIPNGPTLDRKSPEEDIPERIPSSQKESEPKLPRPSQASTVDLTQSQTPRQYTLSEVIWESPTRPVPSSTPLKLPTPRSDTYSYYGAESLVPFSMASSELQTKSQMLPESLLNDSIPGPPPFIQDSDEEDEDY